MKKITLLLSFIVLLLNAQYLRAKTTGSGTETSPYSVSEARTNLNGLKWIKGYIVGYVWTGPSFFFTTDSCTQSTNVFIADSKTETDTAKCIIVQLPSGAIRAGLNLVDNKVNLSKQVTLYGSLEKYFSRAGLKSATYYALEGGTTGGSKPVDISGAIYSETFAASLGSFTANNVIGAQVWGWASGYGAKMSGYLSANIANEDWLISPKINLTNATSASLSFDHTGKFFGTMSTEAVLLISENYISGAPSTASWASLTIPTYMTGTDWTFVNSGNIALTSYLGKNVSIAFKYTSSTTAAATWEIKNFAVIGTTTGIQIPSADVLDVKVAGKKLTITNSPSNTVEIFNTVGAKVQSVELINGSTNLNLAKGLYIVRSGKATAKIML